MVYLLSNFQLSRDEGGMVRFPVLSLW